MTNDNGPSEGAGENTTSTNEDSFQGVVSDFGSTEVISEIIDAYEDQLCYEGLLGERLPLRYAKTATWSYDHGQADDTRVSEVGVHIRFNPDKTDKSSVESNGDIATHLKTIANEGFDNGLERYELATVTEDMYEVWLVTDNTIVDTKE